MSLRDKFKTDPEAVSNGVWVDFPEAANADGTIPGFKLARMSVANPKYQRALQVLGEKIDGQKLTDAQDEEYGLQLLVDIIVLDWRNVQPEDDGKPLFYSKDAATGLLGDPAWADLRIELRLKASNMATFRAKQLDATAKN